MRRAFRGHIHCRSAAPGQLERAFGDGVRHDGLLRRELFKQCSGESIELLRKAGCVGSSDESSARHATVRLDRESARGRGDNRDFALADCCRRSGLLATGSSRFVSTPLFPSNLNLP